MVLCALFFSYSAVVMSKRVTHRPTFLLGYRDHRCFKEMFYEGSTLELATELIEPETMKESYITDPAKDGIKVFVVFDQRIIFEAYLGNKEHNSFLSFIHAIDSPHK